MSETTFRLTHEERIEVENLLDRELGEIHSELRRTESREFQESLRQEEALLRGILTKLRHTAEVSA